MNKESDNAVIEEYCIDSQPIERWEETEEGYLKLWISVAVAGKDLEYYHEDGSKRVEYITQDDLFDVDSLKTAIGKPFTVNHPPEPVLAANYKKYSQGTSLQEIINDNGRLVIASLITDPDTIEGIKSKRIKYTSSAYRATKIPQKDSKIRQTKRKYNHFAMLTEDQDPRAGTDSTIILDSKGSEKMSTADNKTETKTETKEENQQPTMKELLAAISGLGETIKSAITPAKTEPETVNADSTTTETNKDSKTATNTTQELVGLWAEWKPVIEANNKTVDYNLDSQAVKKLVLGCFYDDNVIKKLDTQEKLDGFWLNFEANKDSILKKSVKTGTNNDSSDPRTAFINRVTKVPTAS